MPVETATMRNLRAKQQMTYKDELDDDDLDEVSPRTFSVEEKLESDQYNADFVIEKTGKEITCQLFQETGFRAPMVIKDKTGLGMRVPSDNFTVSEVKKCVGSRRVIDVMDVMTQKGETMTMKDYCSYYEDKSDRDRLLNVISLEFSGTRLDNYVEQPTAVHEVDWVDTVWPTDLKEKQEETTNVLEKMFYPKVQRYCLMSVGGCYTDFHIDMGGTSVWYHILHGKKECGGGDQNNQSGSGQSSDQGSNQGTSQSSGLTYITLTPASFGSGEGLGAGGGGGDEEPPYKQFKKETPAAATYVTITPKKETELEKPSHVVRPAPIPQPPKYVMLDNGLKHPLDRFVWQKIFSFLDHTDLTRCLCVCKTWYRWCLDASLWYRLDMSQKRPFRQHHLIGVVRRQPKNLNLSWTNISYQQMIWLIARLPHLKHLQMSGISWPAVSALCNSSCPLLFSIDLSWVSGMRDKCVRDLLAPPTDHKPGVDDTVSRLHRVVTLNLAGADITDEALQYIPMWTPRVTTLNLSYCIQITDAGIKKICALRLQTLDLTGCRLLTPAILPLFNSIPFLRTVQMEKCPRMTKPAMESFLRTCPGTWKVLPPMGLQKVVKREQASS